MLKEGREAEQRAGLLEAPAQAARARPPAGLVNIPGPKEACGLGAGGPADGFTPAEPLRASPPLCQSVSREV